MDKPNALLELLERCRLWLARRGNLSKAEPCDPALTTARHLRHVAETFVEGFSIAFENDSSRLIKEIDVMHATDRGVGYEGAAAAKTVLDLTNQKRLSFSHLGAEPGSISDETLPQSTSLLQNAEPYTFLLYLGIGEAMAQLKVPPVLCNDVSQQLWSGQILEGYGFFDGYFNWYEAVVNQRYPAALKPELRAFYDQGLGRAIYFISNCNPNMMRDYINNFSLERRRELWAGAGIPIAYVGGPSEKDLKKLIDFAGPFRAEIMQGVLLGSTARSKQLLVPDHTELAFNMVCGMHAADANSLQADLDRLLQKRESYNMYDWQLQMRKLLREDAC